MKSPQLSTFIIAIIFAVIAYFVANSFESTALLTAGFVFIAAFVAPLIGTTKPTATDNETNADITTLYVGNLPYRANEAAIRELFSAQGAVHSVRLMKDKHTGKRRGFGFVEMAAADADNAIQALNDTEFQQRTLKVREAKERPERQDKSVE